LSWRRKSSRQEVDGEKILGLVTGAGTGTDPNTFSCAPVLELAKLVDSGGGVRIEQRAKLVSSDREEEW